MAAPTMFMLLHWFLIQVIGGATSLGHEEGGVAFSAHIGDFAAGALLVVVFRNPALIARHPHQAWSAP